MGDIKESLVNIVVGHHDWQKIIIKREAQIFRKLFFSKNKKSMVIMRILENIYRILYSTFVSFGKKKLFDITC